MNKEDAMIQIDFRKELPQWSGKSRINGLLTVFTREIIYYIQTKHKIRKPLLKPFYKIFYDEEKMSEYLSIVWYVDDRDSVCKYKVIWLNTVNVKPMVNRYIGNRKRRYCYA